MFKNKRNSATGDQLGTNSEQGPVINHHHHTPIYHRKMFLVPTKPSNRFVSRDDIMKEMTLAVRENQFKSARMPVVLKGIGGMGKSEIMLHYCYRHREEYAYIFWLRVDGAKATLDAFRGLAKELGINVKANRFGNDEALIVVVREWLESNSPWLLLLDNLDNPKDVNHYIPATGGDVIATTRNYVSSSWATVIEVDKMTNDQALRLLLGSPPLSDDGKTFSAQNIAKELDCFPLALNIARSYIEQTEVSFDVYLKMIRSNPKLLLNGRDQGNPNTYPETVASVWKLSFKEIERNLLATRILHICAFLQPDAIPASLFQRQHDALALFRKPLKRPRENIAEHVFSAIGTLVEFSFIRRITAIDIDSQSIHVDGAEFTNDMLEIHRVVQMIIRDAMDSNIRPRWMERIVGRAVKSSNHSGTSESMEFRAGKSSEHVRCLENIVAALNQEIVSSEYHNSQIRNINEVHLPQVRHIVAQLTHPNQMAANTKVPFINLLGTTVTYLISGGIYRGTERLAQMAVTISEIQVGMEHPRTALSLHNLALLYFSQGKYDKAESVYMRAMEVRRKVSGCDHPDMAKSLSALAELYRCQGKHNKARQLNEQALAIREKMLGSDHQETATSLNNLAVTHYSLGKYDKAEPLYERARTIYKKVLEPEHPDMAQFLNNLAVLYESQGKYDETEVLHERALEIREKALGSEHPDTAQSLNNLAVLYKMQGRNGKSELLYERALTVREKVLGSEHQATATSLTNLARLYVNQGKYDNAGPLCERALAICEKVLGSEHPDTATSLNNLAALYKGQGKYDKAESLHERALAIREKVLGSEHPDTAQSLNNLAVIHCSQGKYDKADPLYVQALAIYEKVLGSEHPHTARTSKNLARCRGSV